ncbi:hypothetical protein [Streptomyces mexicanus]|jgi:hypothetical protein|uniref:hypothetical protein n=1 Tax=Streptomyces mexicanus TaxID=178566 RepID=UPI00364C4A07
MTGASQDHRHDEQQVVEAVAELREDGTSRESVTRWCAARGIDVLPMAAGVLLTGSARRFSEAFGSCVGNRARAVALPVPDELRDLVRSVTVLPIPGLHSNAPGRPDPRVDESPETT